VGMLVGCVMLKHVHFSTAPKIGAFDEPLFIPTCVRREQSRWLVPHPTRTGASRCPYASKIVPQKWDRHEWGPTSCCLLSSSRSIGLRHYWQGLCKTICPVLSIGVRTLSLAIN